MGCCFCLQSEEYDQPDPDYRRTRPSGRHRLPARQYRDHECYNNYTDCQPTPEERRRNMAEAAERRQQESQGRGVKDPAALQRKQQRLEQYEKQQRDSPGDGQGLKWQVG